MPSLLHLAFVQTAIRITKDSEIMALVVKYGSMSHILPNAQLRLFLNTTKMQTDMARRILQVPQPEINFTIELDHELQQSPNQKWESNSSKKNFLSVTHMFGREIAWCNSRTEFGTDKSVKRPRSAFHSGSPPRFAK
ncbi:hypothetical protein TNIN_93031 [Trichonephila inaurata madagascariensis]|uniref:Uncharacterized protein n=1 Tax=Trichonephila inaurata madagascariensis TaxID=2747483 RepID=A0A8X7BPY7_9ARAC|nr:hypothetical protein TNIN_93031 [Trichonephila inaurata madagascariensis]